MSSILDESFWPSHTCATHGKSGLTASAIESHCCAPGWDNGLRFRRPSTIVRFGMFSTRESHRLDDVCFV